MCNSDVIGTHKGTILNGHDNVPRPAKYTDSLFPVFNMFLTRYDCKRVLDCFAGTGKIHKLPFNTVGLEIEPEWAIYHKNTVLGDATRMPFFDGSFDAVCTSPTYGNRMADCHNAKDGSSRNTYTHKLGRKLHERNTGRMLFGENYQSVHLKAWMECYRVIRRGGVLVVNIKNHIQKGKEVDVFGWHVATLIGVGFVLREVVQISVKGNGFGANADKRVPFEYVALFDLMEK